MPAGYGNTCSDCYWSRTFEKRLAINIEGFSNVNIRADFLAYAEWLVQRVGGKKAALLLNKHMLFFVRIAGQWGAIPSYKELHAFFGSDGLRRAILPVMWMVEGRSLVVDEQVKLIATEERRITEILATVSPENYKKLLDDYYVHLKVEGRGQTSTLRSTRMALSTASSFLKICCARSDSEPSTVELKTLLSQSPGLAASITGFVNFLNARYGLKIKMSKAIEEARKLIRKNLELELLSLMRKDLSEELVLEHWIPNALRYFHGLSKRSARSFEITSTSSDASVVLVVGSKNYWIPLPTFDFKQNDGFSFPAAKS